MTQYGVLLCVVCMLDIIATATGLKLGWWDGEFNPILAWFLNHWGLTGLVIAKIFFNAGAIFILEIVYRSGKIARRRIINYMRLAIIAYLVLFAGGLLLQMI